MVVHREGGIGIEREREGRKEKEVSIQGAKRSRLKSIKISVFCYVSD